MLQFKIEHSGLLSGNLPNGQWAQGQLIANNNSWTTTIPASLKAGEYFLRHELLAIHTSNQPQFYPECAQLIVTVSALSILHSPSVQTLISIVGLWNCSTLWLIPRQVPWCLQDVRTLLNWHVIRPLLTPLLFRSDPGVGIDVYSQPVSNHSSTRRLELTSHHRTCTITLFPVRLLLRTSISSLTVVYIGPAVWQG